MQVMLDIGGSQTRMGISRNGEKIEGIIKWPTPPTFDEGLEKIRTEISKVSGAGQINTVAVGVAGVLDKNQLQLVRSPNLVGWIGKPLAKKLTEITQCEVRLENDAALAALGEATAGAGRRYQVVAYVTVSTGIGGARIVDGKIDKRAIGFEPGHQIIGVNGQIATWENLASGTAIFKIYGKTAKDIDDPAVWKKEAKILAVGLGNVLVMWSPEIIIMGGGVMAKVDILEVSQYLKENVQIFPEIPPVVKSQLEDVAGLWGGLRLLNGERRIL